MVIYFVISNKQKPRFEKKMYLILEENKYWMKQNDIVEYLYPIKTYLIPIYEPEPFFILPMWCPNYFLYLRE